MDFIILNVCKLEDLARLKLLLPSRIFIPTHGLISCLSVQGGGMPVGVEACQVVGCFMPFWVVYNILLYCSDTGPYFGQLLVLLNTHINCLAEI